MTVDKLIKEYENKVALLDTDLEEIRGSIMSNGFDGVDNSELFTERKVKQEQRQAYYQIIKDLEDLN